MDDATWEGLIRDLRDLDESEVSLRAADVIHRTATVEDVPRLRALLKDDSFYVREAAAWPLSELAGAAALPELLQAYQRGRDEGHDNDGFSSALADLAEADPSSVRKVLEELVASGSEDIRDNARWLLDFCGEG